MKVVIFVEIELFVIVSTLLTIITTPTIPRTWRVAQFRNLLFTTNLMENKPMSDKARWQSKADLAEVKGKLDADVGGSSSGREAV